MIGRRNPDSGEAQSKESIIFRQSDDLNLQVERFANFDNMSKTLQSIFSNTHEVLSRANT